MGKFKTDKAVEYREIVHWLQSRGYEKGNGPQGTIGYVRTYTTDDSYRVWVTIDFNTLIIDVYKEYSCGGCVGSTTIEIEEEWLESVKTFIDNVDEELESWLD